MTDKLNVSELLELTTEIVSAHAGNNSVAPADLTQLFQDVYRSLAQVGPGPVASYLLQPSI